MGSAFWLIVVIVGEFLWLLSDLLSLVGFCASSEDDKSFMGRVKLSRELVEERGETGR